MAAIQLNAVKEHEQWLQQHLKSRKGEDKRRLIEGHGYAEKLFATQIWFPVVGHFEYLHPEYAVSDFGDKQRYLDFAYIRPPYRICFELDGFGPHVKDVSRRTFADGLMRQNYLVLDEWRVIRFSVDDLEKNQRKCQQMVMQVLGKWYAVEQGEAQLTLTEKKALRHAIQMGVPIRASELAVRLQMTPSYVRKLLKRICAKGYIVPTGPAGRTVQRVRAYIPVFFEDRSTI